MLHDLFILLDLPARWMSPHRTPSRRLAATPGCHAQRRVCSRSARRLRSVAGSDWTMPRGVTAAREAEAVMRCSLRCLLRRSSLGRACSCLGFVWRGDGAFCTTASVRPCGRERGERTEWILDPCMDTVGTCVRLLCSRPTRRCPH